MENKTVKVEGKLYIKMSSASTFALISTSGVGGAKSTFFILEKAEMLKALDACAELFLRNEENTLCWKGSIFVKIIQSLNRANVQFGKIPCNMSRKDMKLDRHGTRATTQEKFITEFFGGTWIGGLKNSGGFAAGESGRLADVSLQNGRQIEVKGWSGRLAGKVAWSKVEELHKAGIFTDEDVEILRKQL